MIMINFLKDYIYSLLWKDNFVLKQILLLPIIVCGDVTDLLCFVKTPLLVLSLLDEILKTAARRGSYIPSSPDNNKNVLVFHVYVMF